MTVHRKTRARARAIAARTRCAGDIEGLRQLGRVALTKLAKELNINTTTLAPNGRGRKIVSQARPASLALAIAAAGQMSEDAKATIARAIGKRHGPRPDQSALEAHLLRQSRNDLADAAVEQGWRSDLKDRKIALQMAKRQRASTLAVFLAKVAQPKDKPTEKPKDEKGKDKPDVDDQPGITI